jgi:hypothetical protein
VTSRPDPPLRSDDEPDGPEGPEEPQGSLRPTSYGLVTAWAVAGLVLGWLIRPVSLHFSDTAPVVTWFQPAALWLVAVVVALTAWHTWRTVQVRRERLEPHQAVNRLVLGRAAALVGALVAGGYGGYAFSWVGVEAQLGPQRIVRSVVALVAGLVIVVAGLLLERACRVRSDRKQP